MKLTALNESIITNTNSARDIANELFQKMNSKVKIFDNKENITNSKIATFSVSKYKIVLMSQSVDESSDVSFLGASYSPYPKQIQLQFSHIFQKLNSKIKKEITTAIIHEMTHSEQYVRMEKNGAVVDPSKLSDKERKKRKMKQYEKRKALNTGKAKPAKKYLSDPTEVMAFANQFAEVFTKTEWLKLSREISYMDNIENVSEIKNKYKSHKISKNQLKKTALLYFTLFSRTDKTYKKLMRYVSEYMSLK